MDSLSKACILAEILIADSGFLAEMTTAIAEDAEDRPSSTVSIELAKDWERSPPGASSGQKMKSNWPFMDPVSPVNPKTARLEQERMRSFVLACCVRLLICRSIEVSELECWSCLRTESD